MTEQPNSNPRPLKVVVEIRSEFVEVTALPPGVEVELLDYDVGVKMPDGRITPLVCRYESHDGRPFLVQTLRDPARATKPWLLSPPCPTDPSSPSRN